MGIIFNANYRTWTNNEKETVPQGWANTVAEMAPDLARAGLTAVLWPPYGKTQSGSAANADGYGLFDPYDIGSKNQCYSVQVRQGFAWEIRRAHAMVRRTGMQNYGDYVMHQYDGGNNGVYQYLGADGRTLNGRWPKFPSCFVGDPPRVPVDPVFDSQGDFGFGDMCSYVNSQPPGYMLNGVKANVDWMARTIGVDGFRLDDTKGENAAVSRQVIESQPQLVWFGECFTGNPFELESWISQTGGRSGTIDFQLHFALQGVCDSGWAASSLLSRNAGLCMIDGSHAFTYVESPDTDLSPGEQIVNNKGLAYWFILTAPGYPMVYARDYLSGPNMYGLKPLIDNLAWIHEKLANGAFIPRYGDQAVACFERSGIGPGLLTAGNWDTWNKRPVTVHTNFGPNVQLHDYTGHHPDIWTDGAGRASFTIPSNAYSEGKSYVAFSRLWQGEAITLTPRRTVQTFFGAEDLDIPPVASGATPATTVVVGKVYCDANSSCTFTFTPEFAGKFCITAYDEDNASIGGNTWALKAGQSKQQSFFVSTKEMVTFTVSCVLADEVASNFELTVDYLAPEGL